ncbi:MAG: transposase [Planctomycetes bacterium]|nr:transposase [Planctomycetota bacterium]
MTDFDSPWKEALTLLFERFLAYYFPTAHRGIDWTRQFESLDKELQQVLRDAESGRRVVDHLVKVWLTDGTEEWLLIHVEVQAQPEADFATRLYACNYRIFDRFQRPVVTFAILADDRENWRPSCYEYEIWGFRVRMAFPTVKLLDIVNSRTDLEIDANPFAVLTLAHVRTQETRNDPEARRAWKFRLIKSLYQRGLSPDAVRTLFRCIDWMMDLPKEAEDMFWDDVTQFEKENQMPFIDVATRKGMEKGIIESILMDWDYKFEGGGNEYREELQEITDLELLRKILRAGKTAGSLEVIRKLWKPQ